MASKKALSNKAAQATAGMFSGVVDPEQEESKTAQAPEQKKAKAASDPEQQKAKAASAPKQRKTKTAAVTAKTKPKRSAAVTTKAKKEPEPADEKTAKKIFSCRLNEEHAAQWQAYIDAVNEKTGDLTDRAIMEYMKRHKLTPDQETIYSLKYKAYELSKQVNSKKK